MIMQGKNCLITGANSGIGKATAIGLAKEGATIIMVCRDKERGEKAKKEIIELTNNKNVEVFLCDLSSQEDIRKFVSEFKGKYQTLHVLINNAGVMISKRIISDEGLEMNFAVNHLAPFLLTNLLLDILKKSAPSRIINVSSGLHKRGKIDFEDLQNENKKTALFKMYGDSKLALMLWSYELSRRLEGTNVTINTVHPGVVNSNLGRHQSKFSQGFGKLFFKKPEKGAETSIYLASSPEVEGITGKYFVKKVPRQSSKESYNEEYAKRIWDISAKMTGLEF
ncbi:MAG: Rhamnolipids biosynthesis 3-oxoacyl-[acyl-carrier-protein] reductase [Candidatus Lokiarchaeum sp. GC14_75]|nr:MAG: Rhamnolipids biosynthesis 3-oxoacyl-[acyl-carrier-protein] reductase [Candidatus Lokiarchaeum sp. GC14_75]